MSTKHDATWKLFFSVDWAQTLSPLATLMFKEHKCPRQLNGHVKLNDWSTVSGYETAVSRRRENDDGSISAKSWLVCRRLSLAYDDGEDCGHGCTVRVTWLMLTHAQTTQSSPTSGRLAVHNYRTPHHSLLAIIHHIDNTFAKQKCCTPTVVDWKKVT